MTINTYYTSSTTVNLFLSANPHVCTLIKKKKKFKKGGRKTKAPRSGIKQMSIKIADKCGVELDFPTPVNTITILFSAY